MVKFKIIYMLICLYGATYGDNLLAKPSWLTQVSFDGLKTKDPWAFVNWAQKHLDMYQKELGKYKHPEDLKNKLEAKNIERALHRCLDIIWKIKNRFEDIDIRNTPEELQYHYDSFFLPKPSKFRWTNPFDRANYEAYCQGGTDVVVKLPRIEPKQLKQLITQTDSLSYNYYTLHQEYYVFCYGYPKGLKKA